MRKSLLTIFLFLAFAAPALAAKSVQGTVPVIPPLQKAPEGEYPNYSGNVQAISPDVAAQQDQPQAGTNADKINFPAKDYPAGTAGEDYLSSDAKAGMPAGTFGGSAGRAKNLFFLFFALILIAGGVYLVRRGKK